MDAERAVDELEATGRRHETAVRCVGYAALIQAVGWKGVSRHMPSEAVAGLRTAFDEAGLDPGEIEYPHGRTEYLEEVVRSSLHPESAAAARKLLKAR